MAFIAFPQVKAQDKTHFLTHLSSFLQGRFHTYQKAEAYLELGDCPVRFKMKHSLDLHAELEFILHLKYCEARTLAKLKWTMK